MATFSFRDGSLTVNAVDLSDHVASLTIEGTAEELDDTAMGDDWRSMIGGLKAFTLTVTFHQDFAASSVDDTIWPLLGTATAIVAKPTSAAVSATNPSYSGSVLVSTFTPLAGNVGDLAQTSVTWSGTTALTRATA